MAVDGTPKNQARIHALAVACFAAGTVAAAADATGTPRRTAFRWAKSPAFKAAMGDCQRAALESATAGLSAGCNEAVAVLRGLLSNAENDSVKCRAALGLIDAALRMINHMDFDARLRALEDSQNAPTE